MMLPALAKVLREGVDETLMYYRLPRKRHCSVRATNILERQEAEQRLA